MVWVQCLLYASIVCSLFAALGAVLGKQWLDHYMSVGERGTIETRGLERQRKFAALELWHFRTILEFLPILLQASLFLFAIALCAFMWNIQRTVAKVFIVTNGFGFIFYFVSVIASVLFQDCPFQSSLSRILRRFLKPLWASCLDILRYLYLGCLYVITVTVVVISNLVLLNIHVARLCSSASVHSDVEDARPPQGLARTTVAWFGALSGLLDDHLGNVSQMIRTDFSDVLPSVRAFTASLRRPRKVSPAPQDHLVGEALVWLTETSTDPIVLTDAIHVVPEIPWYPDFQVPTTVLDVLLSKIGEGARRREQGIPEPDSHKFYRLYSAFLLLFWNNMILDRKAMKAWDIPTSIFEGCPFDFDQELLQNG